MQEVFARISPARHADRIRSRLFAAQGKNDPRVPYTEAERRPSCSDSSIC
jgi:dipeptidyl aminopeptidase/acylaminoacyl peptidase